MFVLTKTNMIFFVTLNNAKDCGATLSKVRRPERDVLVSVESVVTKCQPDFRFTAFKKPIVTLDYVINEAQIYEEVDIEVKLVDFLERKLSANNIPYIECTAIDKASRSRKMKIFASLIDQVTQDHTYKFTDIKIVLGSQQTKALHTQASTTVTAIDDELLQSVHVEHDQDEQKTRSISGKIINVDKTTIGIIYICSNNDCRAKVQVQDGIYDCECNSMGTIDDLMCVKSDIKFTVKDDKNLKYRLEVNADMLEEFTGFAMSKDQCAKQLLKSGTLKFEIDQDMRVLSLKKED